MAFSISLILVEKEFGMRNYRYNEKWESLLTPEIVALLSKIHEDKGKQALYIESHEDALVELVEIAKIQSTDASNRIEGIHTSDERLKKIVLDKTRPKTRDEEEIAGYRDVLQIIHDSHDYLPVKSSVILQLHRDLFKYAGLEPGGKYKTVDNVIEEIDATGDKRIRFVPSPAWETPTAVEQLCKSYEEIMKEDYVDPLLVIPMFILDFLCIHPFKDGNGRMSRLLTLLLLYRSGCIVGKYVSIEKIIEATKESYYAVLEESSYRWHESQNDYKPFVKYTLEVIASAYKGFSSRVRVLSTSGLTKPDRIQELIKDHLGAITKAEIMEGCPDISQSTIQRTLIELIKEGLIIKIGGGRYTSYVWNRENE